MKLTERQKHLLSHLHEIETRTRASGRPSYFLQQGDYTTTINSLIVRGLIARDEAMRGSRPTLTEKGRRLRS